MRKITFLLLIAALLLTACGALSLANPQDTQAVAAAVSPPALETGSPTATIVWFPATATWTPFPTIVPSPSILPFPGLGSVIYQDDFSDLKNWSFSHLQGNGGNSIILDRNRLTLALNAPPAALFSLNTGKPLSNFYAEVTVSVNRCFGQDTYGLLFRAASGAYTYRYLLNCSGQARMEQIRGGSNLPLQAWVPSGDAPPGAPGLVKMEVWASGAEMRFFLNGRYQFSVIDPVFKAGSLGVYANAVSPDGMNISFSDLTVSSVEYVSPTPSTTPSKTPTLSRTPRPTP